MPENLIALLYMTMCFSPPEMPSQSQEAVFLPILGLNSPCTNDQRTICYALSFIENRKWTIVNISRYFCFQLES